RRSCCDVRFPARCRALAARGASILAVPAAVTVSTGEAHWHVLMRARAIETQCHVVAAAQSGAHADGRQTYGHSVAIDPWGAILADAGAAEEPMADKGYALALAPIDATAVEGARQAIPLERSRAERNATP